MYHQNRDRSIRVAHRGENSAIVRSMHAANSARQTPDEVPSLILNKSCPFDTKLYPAEDGVVPLVCLPPRKISRSVKTLLYAHNVNVNANARI